MCMLAIESSICIVLAAQELELHDWREVKIKRILPYFHLRQPTVNSADIFNIVRLKSLTSTVSMH